MVSIMNGRRMGGMFMMAPQSDPGDGLIDLCLVGQVSQARILPVALKFISGTQVGHPAVQMVRARQISVRAVQAYFPTPTAKQSAPPDALSVEIVACAPEIVTYSKWSSGMKTLHAAVNWVLRDVSSRPCAASHGARSTRSPPADR